MGYSNSKWRKILIILSIINLCFVLFARFSKVFATIDNNNLNITVDGGTITLPSFFTGNNGNNSHNYFLFQDPTDTEGVYNWALFFTRGNSNLIINDNYTVNNYTGPALLSSGSSPNGGLNSGWSGDYFYTIFTGTVAEYQTRLNNFNSVSPLSSGWYSYFLINQSSYNINSLDYENSYIYSIADILDSNGDILYPAGTYIPDSLQNFPHFNNISEIEGSTFDTVYIGRGDYSFDDYLYFHLLEISYTVVIDNNTTNYYYSDKTFALDKNSKYYYTYLGDEDNSSSYYAVPRSALGLNPNSSYLYVLTNTGSQISNSTNILIEDPSNGIYDVLESNTTGIITTDDSINDKIQNIDDTINDTTISPDTEADIENSFDYDNSNPALENLHGGFFSRLVSLFTIMYDYNLNEDSVINIPLPNSNKYITLHSNAISSHIVDPLKSLIGAFWVYVFYMYCYKFLNYILIEIKEGKILDDDSLENAPGALHASIF